MGLHPPATKPAPLLNRDIGIVRCLLFIRRFRNNVIGNFLLQLQELTKARAPLQLMLAMECLGIDLKEACCTLWGIVWVVLVKDGPKEAPWCDASQPALLGMALRHLVLDPPLTGVAGSIATILHIDPMFIRRSAKAYSNTRLLPGRTIDLKKVARGYALGGVDDEVKMGVPAVNTMGHFSRPDEAMDLLTRESLLELGMKVVLATAHTAKGFGQELKQLLEVIADAMGDGQGYQVRAPTQVLCLGLPRDQLDPAAFGDLRGA
jgi:hypothetical protein